VVVQVSRPLVGVEVRSMQAPKLGVDVGKENGLAAVMVWNRDVIVRIWNAIVRMIEYGAPFG